MFMIFKVELMFEFIFVKNDFFFFYIWEVIYYDGRLDIN